MSKPLCPLMAERPDCPRRELERKEFLIRAVLDAGRELAGARGPRQIVETFLLQAMGPLGAVSGFCILYNARTDKVIAVHRGLAPAEAERLDEALGLVAERCFRDAPAAGRRLPVLIRPDQCPGLPPGLALLVSFPVDEEYTGLLGLGEKVTGAAVGRDETDVLLHLTETLAGALRHALAASNISQLNSDLTRKNLELEKALTEARQARRELDRKILHLAAMNDLAGELGEVHHTDELLDRFLLTVMGAFSCGSGLALVLDRPSSRVWTAIRGAPDVAAPDFAAADRLLFRLFDAAENRSLSPMSVSAVRDPSDVLAACGLALDARSAVFFALDQSFLGVAVLGPRLDGEPPQPDEPGLLATHAANALPFFQNARSFETIEGLNQDLTRRNEELSATIRDLTEARQAIDLLERARERIRSALIRESERLGRASWWDAAVLLGLAVALGLLFNLNNPDGAAVIPRSWTRPAPAYIDPAEAAVLAASSKALFLDARPAELHAQGKIPDSLNVPPGLFDLVYMMKLAQEDPERDIVVYGRTFSSLYDEDVAWLLARRGHDNVRVLGGGAEAWKPLAEGKRP